MEKTLTQILLIEDNPSDALLLRDALGQDAVTSFEVTTADRLKLGLELLQEHDFDIILLDLGLPDSQGFETFTKLHQAMPDTPVVILSGLMDEELAFRAIQFGAQDYLVKRQEAWNTAARTVRYAIERQQSQIALRESESRFRLLFEYSPMAYQSLDANGVYVDFNTQLCELLGYEPHELMGERFDTFWSPEMRSTFPRKFERFKKDGKLEADLQLVKKGGTVIEVFIQGKIQYDINGRAIRAHCILHDITARKVADQALRESQERFSTVFRFNPLSIAITELVDGTIIDVNDAFLQMFGYRRREILRHTTFELNMWQNPEEREQIIRRLRRHGEVTNIELKLRRQTGETINVLASYRLIELDGRQRVLNMLNDITDRKQTEKALNDSERRFNALLENGLDNISLINADGVLLWESPATIRTLGYEPNEFVDRNIFEILHPDDRDRILNQFNDLLEKPGNRQRDSFRLKHSNGSWSWVEAVVTNLLDEPSVRAMVVNYRDITEQKEMEQALHKSEMLFLQIFQFSPIPLVIEDSTGTLITANESYLQLTGYSAEEVIGNTFGGLELYTDIDQLSSAALAVSQPNTISGTELKLQTKFGEIRDVLDWNSSINLNENEKVNLCAVIDITERKQAEKALLASQESFRNIFENATVGIFQSTSEGRYLKVNPTMAKIYGFVSPEEMLTSVTDISSQIYVNPSDREGFIRPLIENNEVHDFIGENFRHDGERIWTQTSARVVKDSAGKLLYYEGFIRDITNRKQLEEKIRESEARFVSIFHANPTRVCITRFEDGRFLDVNETFLKSSGYARDEVLGHTSLELNDWVDPQARTRFRDLLKEQGRIQNFETQLRQKSGSIIDILISAELIKLFDESCILSVSLDITERKRGELESKRSSEELTALYETTNDLAIELNVPKLLEQVVERTDTLLESTGGFIYLYDQAHDDLVLTVTTDLGIPTGTRLKIGEGMAGRVALTREPMIVDNYQNWQGQASIFAGQPFRSIVEVPMLSGGELIGVLGVEVKEGSPRIFNETDARLLSLFAGYAASAVRNARLINETDARAQQLRLLYDAGLIVNRELDPQNQLRLLFEMLKRALNADNAGFFRYDDVQRELYIESGVGGAMDLAGLQELRFTLGEERGLVGWVAQNRAPIYLADVQLDARWINLDSEMHSVLWVPVEYDKRLLGVLSVASAQVDAFSTQDQQLVVLFTNQIAVAMENARLFEALQKELTERKQTEQTLQESEQRYRTLIDQTPAIVYIDDSSTSPGSTQFISPYIQTMLGFTPDEWIQGGEELWKDRLYPDDRDQVLAEIKRSIENDEPLDLEYRLFTKDERVVWVHDHATVLRDSAGNPHSVHGVMHDISERKQAEVSLRESEQRFRSLFNTSPDAIVLTDPHDSTVPWRILDCNEAACKMNGYTRAELVGQSVDMLNVAPGNEEAWRVYLDRLRQKGVMHLESTHRHMDGHIFPIEISTSILTIGGRELVLGIDRDITERRKSEDALHASEARLAGIVNSAMDATISVDSEQRIILFNPAAELMFGCTADQALGQPIRRFIPERYRAAHTKHISTFGQAGGTSRNMGHLESLSGLRADGREFPVEAAISHLEMEGGHLYTIILRDITERRQIESERQVLVEIMRGAISTSDLLQYLNLVHDSIAKVIQAENFFIILHNKDTGLFEEIYSVDQYDPPQPPSKLEKSISAYVFRSGKSLLLKQALFDELVERGEVELVGKNSSSWLGVPLITSKETIGVMVVQDYENADRYSESTKDFLVSIAGQVALAVERIKAEEEISRQLSELEALYENGLAINRMLEPKQIAHRIVQVLDRKLKWHHAAVRILHPDSGHLELLALSQPGLDEVQINLQIEHLNQFIINQEYGLSGWVIKYRTAIRSGNLKEHPNYVETYPGIKSGLYIPIRSGEEIIGSIAVESEAENAFTERDERLLTTLANQAAISFVNARLYLRLQHELSERRHTEEKIRKLNVDLEQRVQERTIEIETAHQRLELATASSGIGVWELKSGRDTFYWDERMHVIYGTQADQFTPTFANWEGLIHPDDRQAEQDKRTLAIQRGGYYANEYRIVRADGSLGYINSNAVVLLDAQRNFKDMIGVNMDITTMKQAEATLRLANHELERALRVKDEFLANMSHELRTPLNAILGLSESLEEQIAGELNEKQLKYMHTISESGHHLLTLINDILDLAKIEAGQIKLDITKADMYTVSQSSLRMIKELAQKKNQQIEVEIDDRIELIWADERRLKQMLVNLLSNAIKFTHEGGKIGLTIKVNEPENKILITVWDSGIGIKDSDLQRLFQPFVQLDGGLARESGGTGLGLALVAQMARLHGGSVSVTSQAGVGSRFTISLPWEPALAGDTESKMKITGKFRAIKTQAGNTQQTILLVEDTEEVVMMVGDYLEAAGYKVVIAKNGLDGIAQAKQFHPALILMDVQMPGMDGLEATQRLRGESDFQHTPIIALTALAMQSDRERCLAAGMNEYLSKPVNLKMLVKLMQGFLSGK